VPPVTRTGDVMGFLTFRLALGRSQLRPLDLVPSLL
jgi:hypothetical protein